MWFNLLKGLTANQGLSQLCGLRRQFLPLWRLPRDKWAVRGTEIFFTSWNYFNLRFIAHSSFWSMVLFIHIQKNSRFSS